MDLVADQVEANSIRTRPVKEERRGRFKHIQQDIRRSTRRPIPG